MSGARSRIDAIDFLRGLAIFFVLMNHVNMRLFLANIPYTHGIPTEVVNTLVWNGQYGVQIFSRRLRVFDHVNLLAAQRGYLPGNWDILWSLSVEEMFYLFFPLLCRWRTAFTHGNDVWQKYSCLGGMDAIALGCLTALALQAEKVPPPRWLSGVGIALLIFILACRAQVQALGLVRSGLDMSLCAIGVCMIIAAAARTDWRRPRLVAPITTIGQYSYEIYLTHMFAVFLLFNLFTALGSPLPAVPVLFLFGADESHYPQTLGEK